MALAAALLAPMAAQPAQAHGVYTPPATVVVADSIGSGVGSPPYQPDTFIPGTNLCARSNMAYAYLLNNWGVIQLQANRACGGATTLNLLNGQYNEGPQVASINARTRLALVQAGPNDIALGALSQACIVADCASPAFKQTWELLQYVLPGRLDTLYQTVKFRQGKGGAAWAVGYATPFPRPGAARGPNCPYMSDGDIQAAWVIAAGLNGLIKRKARQHGLGFVDPNLFFAGSDICGENSAFVNVGEGQPFEWLHPNPKGQQLYALAIGTKVILHF